MTKEALLLSAKESLNSIVLKENVFYDTIMKDPERLDPVEENESSIDEENLEEELEMFDHDMYDLYFEEDDNTFDI